MNLQVLFPALSHLPLSLPSLPSDKKHMPRLGLIPSRFKFCNEVRQVARIPEMKTTDTNSGGSNSVPLAVPRAKPADVERVQGYVWRQDGAASSEVQCSASMICTDGEARSRWKRRPLACRVGPRVRATEMQANLSCQNNNLKR